jgi:ABC-type Na+ transport system ATPase subunit NatA
MAKQQIELYQDLGIGYYSGLPGKKKFRKLASVKENISLETGTYHLAASNGSGKTTLLKTLARLIPADRHGQGFKVTGGMQCLFDSLSWDNELTGADVISSFRHSMDMTCVKRLAAELDADLIQPYSVLSRGQRQKINIILVEARAAVQSDAILLYDEPLSGMDVHSVEKIAEHWKATESRVLRVFSEHLKHPSVAIQGTLEIRDQVIALRSGM